MYQDHFGLHDDPFALGPNLRYLFRSRAHAETMAHLSYGLEQGEDIVLISGAIGTGKTLALHNLQAKVSRFFRQVVINVTQLTFREFIKMVLHELGETWPDNADTADLLVRLKDRALEVRKEGQKILLVVDEAQNIDSEALEGIRLLTNIGQPDHQAFQIVLSGQPGLEAMINRPELAQLRQRIRIHYRLEPLSEEETGEYIAHRLAVAGRREPLFTSNAIKKIHALSGGIPRLVNHLAGHALLVAFVDKDRKIDARHVAAEDMPEPPPSTSAEPLGRRGAAGPAVSGPAPPPPAPSRRADPKPAPEAAPAPEAEAVKPPPPPPAPEASAAESDAPRQRRDASTPSREARPEPRDRGRRPTIQPARPTEPPRRGRSRSWIWTWVAVILLVAAGAWALFGDELPFVAGRAGGTTPATTSETLPAGNPPAGGDGDSGASQVAMTPPAEATPEGPAAIEAAPAAAPLARRWVHVASFRDQDRAGRYRSLLGASGAAVSVRQVTLEDGETWQRVLLGPFESEAEADGAAAALEAQGLITFHRLIVE